MKTAEEIRQMMAHSNGTTMYHGFSPFPNSLKATDGAIRLAEMAEAHWLLDAINSYQGDDRLDKDFQLWCLEKRTDDSAVLRGFNDTVLIIEQEFEYTDFPLELVRLYVINGIVLLPSEY